MQLTQVLHGSDDFETVTRYLDHEIEGEKRAIALGNTSRLISTLASYFRCAGLHSIMPWLALESLCLLVGISACSLITQPRHGRSMEPGLENSGQ